MKANIEQDMPPVDILVNNAGIVPILSLREGTAKEVEKIVQVNVTAQVHVRSAKGNSGALSNFKTFVLR